MLDLKEQGNKFYQKGDFLHAAATYTKAIKQEPNNAVLYSNRSAALLHLNKVAKALADAEECVKLDPAWAKGWMRKGMVLESQGQLLEALECFQKANKAAGGDPDYAARIKALKLKTSSQHSKTAKSAAEQAAMQYAEGKLAYARERMQELGSSFPPELHFLHPRSQNSSSAGGDSGSATHGNGGDEAEEETPQPGMSEMSIRAENAFSAPDVLTMFVGEMRQQADSLQATAAVLVAPKSAVSYPQTWRQQAWQYGAHEGVFVQLQALLPTQQLQDDTSDKGSRSSSDGASNTNNSSRSSRTVLNKTWFICLRPNKPPSEPVELGEQFSLLPTLLR